MKDQAQVVVIGGGIYGVNIAYHLAKMGWKDLILLEKHDISSGATAHAAGLVTQFATSQTLMQFRKYSIELYSELGLFNHVGSIRVASTPEQLRELQRSVSRAKGIGMEVEIISPSEARRIMPQLSEKELYGAIYLPRDGHLDPYTTTTAMARLVREMGASIYTGTLVVGIELDDHGRVSRVLTNKGSIKTEIAVIAAGIWSPRVGAMAGIPIPSIPIDHQHIALKAVPGNEFPHSTPCLRDPDNLVYMREEAGGLVIGGYEPNPKARWVDGVPWEHDGTALPPDYERFEQLMEGAIRRIPFLDRAEIISLVCHPGAYSPDCKPLIGPVPEARGVWLCSGVSLNGFGGAGGIGRLLAEWIITGEPSMDIYEFRATRFGHYYSNLYYTVERTRECVKYYYRLRFPNDEYEWARPYRLSAVHTRLQDLGAVFGEKFGWERVLYLDPGKPWRLAGEDQRKWGWGKPPYFERLRTEHTATRERVCLYDLSSFGKLEITGPGALPLLQRVSDSNIDKPIGSAVYTQFLNNNGGVEADLTITRLAEDKFRVITGSGFIANDLAWLRMHTQPADGPVEIIDVTTNWSCLALWGPQARQVLQNVTADDVSNQAIPYLNAKWIHIRGARVLAQRVSYVGELGWELYVEPIRAVQVWDALVEAGKEFGLEFGGYKVLDSLRIEKGYRYFTADVTPMENPYAAGLGFCVDLDKGDFIGRDALLRIKERGIDHKLCTLMLAGEDYLSIYGGEAVYRGGEVVSRVRSGAYGFTVNRNIVYAYLPMELAVPGTHLEVEVFDTCHPAEVTRTVLVDPKGEKLRAQ
jgi:4-methylaminobutanoate oxidase (formaldehyde-forming)